MRCSYFRVNFIIISESLLSVRAGAYIILYLYILRTYLHIRTYTDIWFSWNYISREPLRTLSNPSENTSSFLLVVIVATKPYFNLLVYVVLFFVWKMRRIVCLLFLSRLKNYLHFPLKRKCLHSTVKTRSPTISSSTCNNIVQRYLSRNYLDKFVSKTKGTNLLRMNKWNKLINTWNTQKNKFY